jgi:hypothetical protein
MVTEAAQCTAIVARPKLQRFKDDLRVGSTHGELPQKLRDGFGVQDAAVGKQSL